MKRLEDILAGHRIWLYIVEPMEESFPITEKEFVVEHIDKNWVDVRSVETEMCETRVINKFDYGVSAHSGNRIYIWLSEKNLKRAYEIVKQYYTDKLVKATNEVSKLSSVFSNMEGWEDIFNPKNGRNASGTYSEHYEDMTIIRDLDDNIVKVVTE